ncbi:MAG: hypothetical protein ACRDIE_03350, partial [Chloroflexota bacterium]
MSTAAQGEAFFREMEKLRRGPKRPQALEVAELAREAGLSFHEALLRSSEYAGFGPQRTGESFDALA